MRIIIKVPLAAQKVCSTVISVSPTVKRVSSEVTVSYKFLGAYPSSVIALTSCVGKVSPVSISSY